MKQYFKEKQGKFGEKLEKFIEKNDLNLNIDLFHIYSDAQYCYLLYKTIKKFIRSF